MSKLLKKVVHYICYYYTGSLSRTLLVKLVYLSDVEFSKNFKRKLTDVTYRYDNYGPFSWEIVDCAQELIEDGILKMEKDINMFGDEKFKYISIEKPDKNEIDEYTLRTIKEVINKFSRYSFT
ncbi:MAG: hypothetical protein DRH51_08650, partial [Candidatus Coatesbacteria bacterium]